MAIGKLERSVGENLRDGLKGKPKKRTALQWIKLAGLTGIVAVVLPVMGVLGLNSILENARNPAWVREESYKKATTKEIVENPAFYQGQLVAITDGKIWMNQYFPSDVNTFYKRLTFDDTLNYVNILTINSKSEGEIPTNVHTEFESDVHEEDYREADRILGKNNYHGDFVIKGRVVSVKPYDKNKNRVLKGVQYDYKTGKTTQLDDQVVEVAKQNEIILKGYLIELNGKKFYLGDVR